MAHIGFDLDNVLYPLCEEIHEYLDSAGYEHDKTDPKWEVWEHYGLTEAQWQLIFARGIRDGAFFVDGEPPESAMGVLAEFLSEGHHLYIVTSRNIEGAELYARRQTFRWIYENLSIPWSGIIVSSNKAILPFHSFIDDHTANLEVVQNSGILGVGFDQPWNQDWQGTRCKSLWEYYEIVAESLEG